MAGINSRRKFDNCDIDNIIAITMKPGKYTVSEDQLQQNPLCVNNVLPMSSRIGRVSALDQRNSGALVDIESHLHNIDVPLSHCSNNRTLPERITKGQELAAAVEGGVCGIEEVRTAYSRLDIPSNIYRESTTHRFDFPLISPSEFVYFGIEGTEQVGNNRNGINTRLQAKDMFKARVRV